MSAAGKVLTGFSLPYVALYAHSGTTVSYSSGQKLARGVSVSIEPESGDENNFYADNIAAESSPGVFTNGTVTLTVDGLLAAAEKLIMGLPTADQQGFMHYGDGMAIPYVGIGFVCRYQSDGVTTFTPVILRKCRFTSPGTEANTQEEEIDWQTQELSAAILRDDSATHDWKYVGGDESSESEAEAKIKTAFSIT